MKNYIQMLVITLVIVGSCLHVNDIAAAQGNPVVSTSTGPNSLVDAIKGYSDITERDVDKWKFLKLILGKADVIPAAAITGASAYGAYTAATAGFNYINQNTGIQDYISPMMTDSSLPDVVKTSKFWAGVLGLGTGMIALNYLYPRMRQGVLTKVQNFIDVCGRLTIAQQQMNQFPVEWSTEQPIAVCKALNNLENQARLAVILLNQVGRNDPDVINKLRFVNFCYNNLFDNKNNQFFRGVCQGIIQTEDAARREELRNRGENALVSGLEIRNTKDYLHIVRDGWKFAKDVVQTGRDVVNWSVQNNLLPIGMLGAFAYWWKK